MEFLGVGVAELIFILLIAMMVFGPRRLPEIAAKLGKFVADMRMMSQGLMTEWQREISVSGRLEEIEQARQDIAAIKQDLKDTKQELGQAQKDVAKETKSAKRTIAKTTAETKDTLKKLAEEKDTSSATNDTQDKAKVAEERTDQVNEPLPDKGTEANVEIDTKLNNDEADAQEAASESESAQTIDSATQPEPEPKSVIKTRNGRAAASDDAEKDGSEDDSPAPRKSTTAEKSKPKKKQAEPAVDQTKKSDQPEAETKSADNVVRVTGSVPVVSMRPQTDKSKTSVEDKASKIADRDDSLQKPDAKPSPSTRKAGASKKETNSTNNKTPTRTTSKNKIADDKLAETAEKPGLETKTDTAVENEKAASPAEISDSAEPIETPDKISAPDTLDSAQPSKEKKSAK